MGHSIKRQLLFLSLFNITIMLAILSVTVYLFNIVERVRQNQAAADRIVKVIQQARIAEKAYRQYYVDEYRRIVFQKTAQAKQLLPGNRSDLEPQGGNTVMELILLYEDIFSGMIASHEQHEDLNREIQHTMNQVQAGTKVFMDAINARQFNARTLQNSALDQMELGLLSPLQDVNYLSLLLLLSHQRFLRTNDTGHLLEFDDYFNDFGPGLLGAIRQGAAYLGNPDYKQLIRRIKGDLKTARQLIGQSQALMEKEEKKVLELDRIGRDLEEQTGQMLTRAMTDSNEAKLTAVRIAILIFVAGSGLIISISVYLIQSINRPLNRLVEASNAISQGDLKVNIPRTRHTEFTTLGNAFNNMISNLGKALDSLEKEVSERRNAEKKLKKLSHRIILNQEMERAALARELHDEVGQVLTALKIDAVWIKKNGGTDHGRRMKRIQQMCDFIDKSFDDIKGLALRLRPKVLDDMGLSIALRWLCKDFQARNKVVCKVNIQDLQIQSDIVSTALYRIAQESLTNVMRHANATQVRLSLLETESDGLVLTVEDNGNGFDPSGIREKEALGMAGMIERAELIGARLAVDSFPGRGCRIRLHMKHPHKKDTIK